MFYMTFYNGDPINFNQKQQSVNWTIDFCRLIFTVFSRNPHKGVGEWVELTLFPKQIYVDIVFLNDKNQFK